MAEKWELAEERVKEIESHQERIQTEDMMLKSDKRKLEKQVEAMSKELDAAS